MRLLFILLRGCVRTAAMVAGPVGLLAVLLAVAVPAAAIGPDELLDDPALEARARALSKQLRCVVCQNQSIDDSNAEIARDMRLVVRDRLLAGDSDREVIEYLVARYGDYVLLEPPFKFATWPLWLGPPALVIAVLAIVALRTRRLLAVPAADEAVSDADRERLARIVAAAQDEAPPRADVEGPRREGNR